MLSKISTKKVLVVCSTALFFSCAANAQSTEKIIMRPKVNKVPVSLYNKITVVDVRPDTTGFGIVQTGMMNTKSKVILKQPLAVQFNYMLADLIDGKAQNGELLIQLHQVVFAELTKTFSEKGFFSLRADAFAKDKDGYKKISSIDTLIAVSAMDVTHSLLKKGALTISDFIASNLNRSPKETASVTYTEIAKVDSIGKRKFKLYNTATYVDGLYKTYEAFANQVPDGRFSVDGKKISKKTVKPLDNDYQPTKLNLETIYAVVYQGKPYVATKYDLYPLEKKDDDFYFTGKVPPSANTSEIITGAVLMGVAGALLAVGSNVAPTFEVKLYYKNGDFIRQKEIITDFGY